MVQEKQNASPIKRGKSSLTLSLALIALSSTVLTSCNHMKAGMDDGGIYDPFETTNRYVMSFNNAVDTVFINPIIRGYRTVAPEPVRNGLRNFLRNLRSPITLANQLLQGDLDGARDAAVRAAVNTTVGVGGIFDVAGKEGIPYEAEDFGQTLGVWGVSDGPYLVVPFIGPSTLRDYGGYFVDGYADPLRIYLDNIDQNGIYYAKAGADYLDIRDSLYDSLTDLHKSSIDYYASVRSTYYQYRKGLIADQKGSTAFVPAIPNYDAGEE